MTTGTRETAIAGGTVVTPTECIEDGVVRIQGDRIVDVGREATDAVDASGRYVLPGLVDLHGDDVEHHLAPRPSARVDVSTALCRSDVATISAGITTKFDAVSFENPPDDLRSVGLARELAESVRSLGPGEGALADHRLHVRCELTDGAGVDAAIDEVAAGASLVSLVEHVPGEGEYADPGSIEDRYRTDGASAVVDSLSARESVDGATRHFRADRVVDAARDHGVPVASHDDCDAHAVDDAVDMGVDVCEFPLTLGAARAASRQGVTVAAGAPNVVRGESLKGNLDVRRAIHDGIVDVLCSDYRPQSLLDSLFVDVGTLTERVDRVSRAPADAVGLSDRGRLSPGARADVIVVDPDPVPSVTDAFVAGECVYSVDR